MELVKAPSFLSTCVMKRSKKKKIFFSTKDQHGEASSIVYFWQGRHTPRGEIAISSGLALELAKSKKGASQIRVVQNKEPKHFVGIFGGELIIHNSHYDERENHLKKNRCYQVKGTTEFDTCVVEGKLECAPR